MVTFRNAGRIRSPFTRMNNMQTETQTITPAPTVMPRFITVTEAAAGKIRELLSEEGKTESGLRVFVQGGGCSGFQYGLMIEEGGAASATSCSSRTACGCSSIRSASAT